MFSFLMLLGSSPLYLHNKMEVQLHLEAVFVILSGAFCPSQMPAWVVSLCFVSMLSSTIAVSFLLFTVLMLTYL